MLFAHSYTARRATSRSAACQLPIASLSKSFPAKSNNYARGYPGSKLIPVFSTIPGLAWRMLYLMADEVARNRGALENNRPEGFS